MNTEPHRNSKLLRWAGSKTQSAKVIEPFLDFQGSYIEPFCGSASFFFSRAPKSAVLNDSNKGLISFYRHLRRSPTQLWQLYNSFEINKDRYYELRDEYNSSHYNIRKAAIFMYLNHFCFNGLYRTNSKGAFNTPFNGSKKTKSKLSLDETKHFARSLKNSDLYCTDFEKFLQKVNPVGACIFMDPPYFTEESRVFTEYGSQLFKIDDLGRLLQISEVVSQKNLVVITHKECSEFRSLFGDYIRMSIPITRNVGGFSGRRKRDIELLAVLGKL